MDESRLPRCPTCTGQKIEVEGFVWCPKCEQDPRGLPIKIVPDPSVPPGEIRLQYSNPDPLIEALADYAHAAWTGWMKYLFSKTRPRADGEKYAFCDVVLPEEFVTRWQHQCATPYTKLTEKEKESDRAEARKMIEIVLTKINSTELLALLQERGLLRIG